ncbi:MAG: GNAT family N-acetyltransferase [Rhodanobacteraceae bacterium]|jgi:GNAT superfamily N-acetyltransferase|nr:GNAT family N-acetyltransferase [Rhodanobacteraceae bacterium]
MTTARTASTEFMARMRWEEYARSGDVVQIRPICPSDKTRERAFLGRLSAESRANRFIGLVKDASDDVAEELTSVDPIREVTLAAFAHPGAREVEIGAACYRASEDGSRCDCTVTVDPAWQKLGIGTALMRHLIDVARSRGIRRMYAAAVATGPSASHMLAERLGFHARPDPEDPLVTTFELELA